MDFNNLSGSFGTDTQQANDPCKNTKPKSGYRITDKLKNLSTENWVDIVCCTIIAAALIAIFCNWEIVMNGLFYSFLFPIIKVLAKAIAIIAGVLCVGGVITARISRRHSWYY